MFLAGIHPLGALLSSFLLLFGDKKDDRKAQACTHKLPRKEGISQEKRPPRALAIMFFGGFSGSKLKTNLKMAIHRINLVRSFDLVTSDLLTHIPLHVSYKI